MVYDNIIEGTFLERPNRFIAHVIIDGKVEICHVKNTGRCRELLQPGVTVYLQKHNDPSRKTNYSLITVRKGERLVNIDSQAPNKIVHEWLKKGYLFPNASLIAPEKKYGKSRIDFYIEENGQQIFMEVKGCTLEEDGVIRFPDAPTERGVKHIYELCEATKNGFEAYIFFVIQMKDVVYFTPNMETHREFGEALCEADKCGVHILAYDCQVGEASLEIRKQVEVRLPILEIKNEMQEPELKLEDNMKQPQLKLEDNMKQPQPKLEDNMRQPKRKVKNKKSQQKSYIENNILIQITPPLLSWYDSHARVLPWRENPSSYRVWISEIMLQQTRVEAVKPYFERFIQALPAIEDLAHVEEDALLKLWEGLGYYNRARNLKKAAQMVIDQYKGEIPSDYEELLKLPGIGSYTAGAISSIAYGKPVPAVDGNVLRVISRVTANHEDILKQSVKNKMEQDLLAVMPVDRPGAFNQALMEIGAMVCVPNGLPKCEECPLNHLCKARELNITTELPKKTPKKPRKIEDKTILIIKSGDKVAIRKRKEKGLLEGLYEFPNEDGHLTEDEVIRLIKKKSFNPIRIQKLEESKHIFTHREWHMIGYVIKIEELDYQRDPDGTQEIENLQMNDYIFIEPEETKDDYPIPTAFQVYTKYMNMILGNEKFRDK